MKIIIETIPHATHRYPTVGDWYRDAENNLIVKVSGELTDKQAALVAVHELIEVLLCEDRGITTAEVDAFDIEYEKNRPEGDTSEPGDSTLAPYKKEHFFATNVERLFAAELGVDWEEYDAAINALP